MNILMLYTQNPFKTSGSIPMDLLSELKNEGHSVRLLVKPYDPNYPKDVLSVNTSFSQKLNEILLNRIKYHILSRFKFNKTDPKYHFHSLKEQKQFYSTNRILKKSKIKPDAIILFFVKDFISAKNIYELYKETNAPIYWLLYDMAPMTGGCHFAWDCKGYLNKCGNCPGLFSNDPHDNTFKNLELKKKYLDNTDIRIVVGSEWQAKQAKQSSIFKNHPTYKILSAFNKDIFKPLSKELIRKNIGIPNDKKIIFFGAYGLSEKRKGIEYLLDSFKILKDLIATDAELNNKIILLIAGNGFEKIKSRLIFECHHMGMLDNAYGIASAYQAADLFVCPSIEDSGPTMINQSLMCGTPVVSFEMGVALDLVFNGKTGYRAKLKDREDLAKGMYDILSMHINEYENMKSNCRQLALDLFQTEVNVNNWLQILNSKDETSHERIPHTGE